MRRVDVAIEAAKLAGSVIRGNTGADLNIQEKDSSRTSIVTAADLRSQQEVIRNIRRASPHDLIVGEEGRDGNSTSPSRWYVDPLDGTTNYAHRLPFYCVSIAYCDADGVATGVIYDPVRNEMFTAIRDGGATLNGCPIMVRPILCWVRVRCRPRFSPMMQWYWTGTRAGYVRSSGWCAQCGPWGRRPLPTWLVGGSMPSLGHATH